MSERQRYLEAAAAFADLVDRLPPDGYDGPGLGEWDLRALVGHASRSLVTVATYLDHPADEPTVRSSVDYYLLTSAGSFDAAAVTRRGVDAGAALGDDPAHAVHRLVEQVRAKLESFDDDYVLTTIVGPMRLVAYLPTRTFELVVHGLDVARATGVPATYPEGVVAEAVALAGSVAVRTGRGPDLLLALTGRTGLPDGFSVV
jgi:uncharacterized protein (TIGR03083 family)